MWNPRSNMKTIVNDKELSHEKEINAEIELFYKKLVK